MVEVKIFEDYQTKVAHVFEDVWQRYSSGQLSGAGLGSRSEYSPMTELFANFTL